VADFDAGAAGKIRMGRGHAPMVTAAGRFLGFGKGTAHHNGIRSAGERFADVAAFYSWPPR